MTIACFLPLTLEFCLVFILGLSLFEIILLTLIDGLRSFWLYWGIGDHRAAHKEAREIKNQVFGRSVLLRWLLS